MVFSIMGLINFAHGELLTIGGYVMWVLFDHGAPWPVVIPATLAATTLAAVAMERVAFRPLRGASVVTLLVTSFAVSFFIQNAFGIGISARPQGVLVPSWVNTIVEIGPYAIPVLQIITTAVTLGALALLVLFLRRTMLGVSMRAAAEDFATTRLMGVRANRVIFAAFAISGLLAGLASLLYTAQAGSVNPATGTVPIVKAFIAVIIGGLGSLSGAVAGGFVLGFTEVILHATLPQGVLPFTDALSAFLVISIILLRPQGLLGKRTWTEQASLPLGTLVRDAPRAVAEGFRALGGALARRRATEAAACGALRWRLNAALGAALLSVALVGVAAYGWTGSASTQSKVISFFINVVLVLGLQMFAGNSGVLSFGHMAFVGIGAYTAAILMLDPGTKAALTGLPGFLHSAQLSFPEATLIAAAVAGAIAVFAGLPLMRLTGPSAVIFIFAVLLISNVVFSGWTGVTHGAGGLYAVPYKTTVGWGLAWAVIAVFAARYLKDARAGLMLQGSREDELAAPSVGVAVKQVRLQAWVLSAMVSAVAGAMLGSFLTAFSPDNFFLQQTFIVIVMLIVGGSGTVGGAVLGAGLVTFVQEVLRQWEDTSIDVGPIHVSRLTGLTQLALVLMILSVMYFRREGIAGRRELDESVHHLLRRRGARRRRPSGGGPAAAGAAGGPAEPGSPVRTSS